MRQNSDMHTMKVKRDDLITALEKNRRTHRKQFLEAQKGYRKAVIKELDSMIKIAQEGSNIKRSVTWPEPKDHTPEYDSAISMLKMCVDKELFITSMDFQQLVMDEWGWKADWTATASNYLGK